MLTQSVAAKPPLRPVRLLGELWSGDTWRRVQFVATGAVLAFAGGLLLIPLLALGLVLSPTVIGAVLAFALVLACSRALAHLHRGRAKAFVGLHVHEPVASNERPQGWLQRFRVESTQTRTWRQLGYHLAAFILSIFELVVVAVGWGWGIVLLPAVAYASPILGVSTWMGIGASAVGIALLLAAPWATRLVAWLDGGLTGRLLGTPVDEMLTERLAEVTESRAGMVGAADAERRRIERDLHDGVQQRLTSLGVHLGMAKANVEDDEMAKQALDHAHGEVKAALADLRDFLRGLHPAVLDDRGLDAALSGIAARSPIPVRVDVELDARPPREVEAVAYFLVSEALTNVLNHAEASHASIEVTTADGRLRVTVRDDGRGGADPTQGSGLQGLRQRIASVDGTMRLDSPLGGPTVVTGVLPCAS